MKRNVLLFLKLIIVKKIYWSLLEKLLKLEKVGFSMIELMIIVLMIGVLVAIVVFGWSVLINN